MDIDGTSDLTQDVANMPVLLSTEELFDTWLNGSTKEALALARPFPADKMPVQVGSERKDLLDAA